MLNKKIWLGKPIRTYIEELNQTVVLLDKLIEESQNGVFIKPIKEKLEFDAKLNPTEKIFLELFVPPTFVRGEDTNAKEQLKQILSDWNTQNQERYSSHLYSQSEQSILKVKNVSPNYNEKSKEVDARVILRDNFERILSDKPEVLIFGEDSGQIGGVNQGLEAYNKNLAN